MNSRSGATDPLPVKVPGEPRRRPGLVRRILCLAIGCLLLAGCSTVKQPSPPTRSPSGYQGSNQQLRRGMAGNQQPKKEETSWFGSLFKRKEPDPPKSVNEFLRQPRPELPPAA